MFNSAINGAFRFSCIRKNVVQASPSIRVSQEHPNVNVRPRAKLYDGVVAVDVGSVFFFSSSCSRVDMLARKFFCA